MERNAMRIRFALLGLFLGPLVGWGAEPVPLAGQTEAAAVVQPAGDMSNITEYLEHKFQIPEAVAPPGSNDLVTADGRIFRNVQVWKNEPDGVTIHHDEGLTKLEFPLLPEAWQKKYGYDPEAAAAYQRAVAEAIREAERNQQMFREQLRTGRP